MTGGARDRAAAAVRLLAARGEDITRSAAGRHAGELLLGAPAAALRSDITWTAVDSHRAAATVHVGRGEHEVMLTFAADGALTELVMRRWGNPGKEPFAEHVFGATMHEEVTFEGFTIPRSIVAGWHYGTDRWPDGQFIRYTIDDAHYR